MLISIVPIYADNGEHSHWAALNVADGSKVWSQDPDEDLARGFPVTPGFDEASRQLDALSDRCPDCFTFLRAFNLSL